MLRMIAGKLDVQRYTAKTDHCAYPRGTQGLRLQFRLHLVLNKWNAGSGSSWRKEVEGLGNTGYLRDDGEPTWIPLGRVFNQYKLAKLPYFLTI
jgi:hypothetical protein